MTKFIPKCLTRKKGYLGHSCSGFVTPCCYFHDHYKDQIPQLYQDKFNISNVDNIEDIIHSKEWEDFFDTVENNPENLPDVCKNHCWKGVCWNKDNSVKQEVKNKDCKYLYEYTDIKAINLDTTNLCSSACSGCNREKFMKLFGHIPGGDISSSDFKKIAKYFDEISFCGMVSDPSLHSDFYGLLEIAMSYNCSIKVNISATARNKDWFLKCFNLCKDYPKVKWIFGIDGKPEDSHIYRRNQNGSFLFDMMKLCSEYGIRCEWRYIVFNYNENDIDYCQNIADKINVDLKIVESGRWYNQELQSLKPTNRYSKEFSNKGNQFTIPK